MAAIKKNRAANSATANDTRQQVSRIMADLDIAMKLLDEHAIRAPGKFYESSPIFRPFYDTLLELGIMLRKQNSTLRQFMRRADQSQLEMFQADLQLQLNEPRGWSASLETVWKQWLLDLLANLQSSLVACSYHTPHYYSSSEINNREAQSFTLELMELTILAQTELRLLCNYLTTGDYAHVDGLHKAIRLRQKLLPPPKPLAGKPA